MQRYLLARETIQQPVLHIMPYRTKNYSWITMRAQSRFLVAFVNLKKERLYCVLSLKVQSSNTSFKSQFLETMVAVIQILLNLLSSSFWQALQKLGKAFLTKMERLMVGTQRISKNQLTLLRLQCTNTIFSFQTSCCSYTHDAEIDFKSSRMIIFIFLRQLPGSACRSASSSSLYYLKQSLTFIIMQKPRTIFYLFLLRYCDWKCLQLQMFSVCSPSSYLKYTSSFSLALQDVISSIGPISNLMTKPAFSMVFLALPLRQCLTFSSTAFFCLISSMAFSFSSALYIQARLWSFYCLRKDLSTSMLSTVQSKVIRQLKVTFFSSSFSCSSLLTTLNWRSLIHYLSTSLFLKLGLLRCQTSLFTKNAQFSAPQSRQVQITTFLALRVVYSATISVQFLTAWQIQLMLWLYIQSDFLTSLSLSQVWLLYSSLPQCQMLPQQMIRDQNLCLRFMSWMKLRAALLLTTMYWKQLLIRLSWNYSQLKFENAWVIFPKCPFHSSLFFRLTSFSVQVFSILTTVLRYKSFMSLLNLKLSGSAPLGFCSRWLLITSILSATSVTQGYSYSGILKSRTLSTRRQITSLSREYLRMQAMSLYLSRGYLFSLAAYFPGFLHQRASSSMLRWVLATTELSLILSQIYY